MHRQRLILMIVAAIGAISVLLPWLQTDGQKQLGISSSNASYFAVLAFICTIILCTYGDKSKPLHGIYQIGAALLCGIATIIGIAKVLSVVGIGLVLLQLCGAAGIAIALNVSKKKDDGIKEIE